MSQYPSPYTPPPFSPYQPHSSGANYYAAPPADALAPARRASLLMIVLGAVLLALAACLAGIGQLSKTMALPPDAAARMQQIEAQAGVSFARFALGVGITLLVIALLMIGLGVAVRSGRKPPIVLAIVASGMALLFIGTLVLAAVGMGLSNHNPETLVSACMWTVPGGLTGLLLAWLISALRASSQVTTLQNQYAAQYWQYQQNMQNYAGYGYGTPTPPDPATTPPDSPTPQ